MRGTVGRVGGVVCAVGLLVLWIIAGAAVVAVDGRWSAAVAGEEDTHLSATYVLARQAGFTHAEAETIARANNDVDYNPLTQPTPRDGEDLARLAYIKRLEAYHAMVPNAKLDRQKLEDYVRGNLGTLRAEVLLSTNKDAQLKAFGRYLHALQDAYFHQEGGKPFESSIGHAVQGHLPDKVASHFSGAARAYAATSDALRQFNETRAAGTKVDLPTRPIYNTGGANFGPGELQEIGQKKGILTLAKAVADSYVRVQPVGDLTADPRGVRRPATGWTVDSEKVFFGNRDAKVLEAKLMSLAGGDPTFKPPITSERGTTNRSPSSRFSVTFAKPQGTPGSIASGRVPGGISLSMAAALRIAIDLDLDGLYFSGGQIVLSGRGQRTPTMDASLFLTALRLACESGDPYFSLDPPQGSAWNEEGRRAADALAQLVESKRRPGLDAFSRPGGARKFSDGLTFETFSAKRDFPQLWARFPSEFPNLVSELVFRPLWLRETRVGEILYKADVLLKELSGGLPALDTAQLRASKIERYMASDARSAARTLLAGIGDGSDAKGAPEWRGHRLWFDLLAQSERPDAEIRAVGPNPKLKRRAGPVGMLEVALEPRGFYGSLDAGPIPKAILVSDRNAFDLSSVYPRMFVRQHDHATRQDIAGDDPDLGALSHDVNFRITRYANAHEELQALTDVFRAYVAAVGIAKREASVCRTVERIPLLVSERTKEQLPEFHRTEIFMTVATFVYSDGRKRYLRSSSVRSNNGGISLRGKFLHAQELQVGRETAITRAVTQEVADGIKGLAWKSAADRHFVALAVDRDNEVEELARLRSFKPVTAEEVFRELERPDGKGVLRAPAPGPMPTSPTVRIDPPPPPPALYQPYQADPVVAAFLQCAGKSDEAACKRNSFCTWNRKVCAVDAQGREIGCVGGFCMAEVHVTPSVHPPAPKLAQRPNPPPAAEAKSLKPVAVQTGVIRRKKARGAIAPLRITTPSGDNYVVKLVDATTNAEEMLIYIEAGRTYETKVPLGTYRIRGASGSTWYGVGDLFGPSTSFFELRGKDADNTFAFVRVGNQLTGRQITLVKQVGGNLETNVIGKERF